MIVVSIILLVLSSLSKSLMDVLSFRFQRLRIKLPSQYWDPIISSNNKNTFQIKAPTFFPNVLKTLWYKSVRWLFRNTLVFITDGWHLSQFIFLNTLFFSLVTYQPIVNLLVDFLIYRGIFGIIFFLTYNHIYVKK